MPKSRRPQGLAAAIAAAAAKEKDPAMRAWLSKLADGDDAPPVEVKRPSRRKRAVKGRAA